MPRRMQGSKHAMEVRGSAAMGRGVRHGCAMALTATLFWATGPTLRAHAQQTVVCDRGSGQFQATFETGVSVRVAAVPQGGFASRACQAVLSRGHERVVAVPSAAQIDLDVMGADPGLGMPVAAFTVRTAEHDWRSSYEIWSLEKQPRRLRTLTGGDTYRAVDADFNGYVAIWTTDASAVEGFEGFTHADYEFPPRMVLRFERGKLVDVSALYRAQYDRQIAKVRSQLSASELAAFRKSDGSLRFNSAPPQDLPGLRKTKVRVLEIVWAYLYSGRPARAWKELDQTWPPADRARVKSAILKARAHGVETQVAKIASAKLPPKWRQPSFVYQFLRAQPSASKSQSKLNYGVPGLGDNVGPVSFADEGTSSKIVADTAPVAILLWRPAPRLPGKALLPPPGTLLLTIDEAGKVWSAQMVFPGHDPKLLRAARDWKFIPALLPGGRPVAYRLKLVVTPSR